MTRVFVYGTLKRGGSNHRFLAGQRFVGPARTSPGLTLYAIGDYPGMVRAPEDRAGVDGEIWEVDRACLAQLDELEGLDERLYERAPVSLLPPNDSLVVEAYLYLRDVSDRPLLGANWPV